ncbi:hypothetical protein OV079_30270 [Nannocystis pusilla]|uniref:Uncharacterized protein n=1 Tax=Nannocystis pusilla TaxID=889268 RepID=A0A9X3EUQ3_9BACT|nr:hypothetical protein [Nannocystis pusilla]MCY1009774.1 hypothetical protein [Nannocystis pusilla]
MKASSRSCSSVICPPSSSRAQQHRQQVALVAAAGAPGGDDAADGAVDARAGLVEPAVLRQRQAGEPRQERVGVVGEALHDDVERAADGVGDGPVDAGGEQGVGDDVEGEPHHRRVDVEHLSFAPGRGEALGVVDHHRGVGGDPLAVEGGLGQPPLAAPEVAVADEQAVAGDEREVAGEAVLDEQLAAADQHLVDELGVGDQVGREPGQDDLVDRRHRGLPGDELLGPEGQLQHVAGALQSPGERDVEHTRQRR